MNRTGLLHLTLMAGVASLAACTDNTAPAGSVDDAQVTADVARSAGDDIAGQVALMLGNESFAVLPAVRANFDLFGRAATDSVVVDRTRTCYDAQDQVVANCAPATTRKVVFHVAVDGSRTGTSFTGVVHRVLDLTVVRNFSGAPATEVSRTHDGVGTSADTTTFTGDNLTRTHAGSATDSIVAVTWNLPRVSNPFPVSGRVVRRMTLHVTVEGANRSGTRDVQRRAEVIFPADAQGNVVLTVNDLTCNLNLVTHAVTGCH